MVCADPSRLSSKALALLTAAGAYPLPLEGGSPFSSTPPGSSWPEVHQGVHPPSRGAVQMLRTGSPCPPEIPWELSSLGAGQRLGAQARSAECRRLWAKLGEPGGPLEATSMYRGGNGGSEGTRVSSGVCSQQQGQKTGLLYLSPAPLPCFHTVRSHPTPLHCTIHS